MSSTQQEEGFTLVELLVSMAVLSLMAIYSLNALSLIGDMRDVAKKQERRNEIETVLRHLANELTAAPTHFVADQTGQGRLLFEGLEHEIAFAALSDGSREFGGLYLARYGINSENQLVARRKLLRQQGEPASIILLNSVSDLVFTYESRSAPWIPTDRLPSRLSISLNDEQTGERFSRTAIRR